MICTFLQSHGTFHLFWRICIRNKHFALLLWLRVIAIRWQHGRTLGSALINVALVSSKNRWHCRAEASGILCIFQRNVQENVKRISSFRKKWYQHQRKTTERRGQAAQRDPEWKVNKRSVRPTEKDKCALKPTPTLRRRAAGGESSETKTRPSSRSSQSASPEMSCVASLTTEWLHRQEKSISGIGEPSRRMKHTHSGFRVRDRESTKPEVANRRKCRSRNHSWAKATCFYTVEGGMGRIWPHFSQFILNSRNNLYNRFITRSMALWKPFGGHSEGFLISTLISSFEHPKMPSCLN